MIHQGKYVIGVDVGSGTDRTAISIVRIPIRIHLRWNRKRKCLFCRVTFPSQKTYNVHVNKCQESYPRRERAN